MGNAYTTSAAVLNECPPDVSAAVQALIAGWIEDVSRQIDAAVPNYSTPFKAVTGSPVTPPIVEEAARYLVADRVLRKTGLLRYDTEGRLVDSLKAAGDLILRQLRDGDRVIPTSQL